MTTQLIEACAKAMAEADGFVFDNLPDGLVFMCSTDDGEPLPLAWGKRGYLHRARAVIPLVLDAAAEVAMTHLPPSPSAGVIAMEILALKPEAQS